VGHDLRGLPRRGTLTARRVDTSPTPLVELTKIREAAATLRGVTLRTPLVALGDAARRHFLKAESLQPIGAFKLRGAFFAVHSLTPAERARGVITYSSGNHAQGVARAARMLGCRAVVVMPENAPALKRARVLADGAEVVTVGNASAERQAVAERLAAERGLAIIPPFDDDRIIAGQATCGLEIAEDLPDVALVLVPVGGGGLAAGVATAIKALCPGARVIGVEPELAADARASLARGKIVEWSAADVSRTIADGTRTQALGVRTFAHLRAHLDAIVTVSEAEIAAGVRIAAEEARLVVEPSGALVVAALRFHAREFGAVGGPASDGPTVDGQASGGPASGGPVVGIVSGGNVDPDLYRELLTAPIPPSA
jgi:threonine dehydratase